MIKTSAGSGFVVKCRRPGCHGLRHGVLQAGFYDMDMARVQRVHDGILYVEAADLIARQRKRDSGGEADIAAAHDLDFFHAFSLLCMQTYKDTISYFLRFCKQSLHHIRLFPRQTSSCAAKVAVTRRSDGRSGGADRAF